MFYASVILRTVPSNAGDNKLAAILQPETAISREEQTSDARRNVNLTLPVTAIRAGHTCICELGNI